MFRKLALAAVATTIGIIAADKLTAGRHITLNELLDFEDGRAKGDRPTFTSTVAHSVR